MCCEGLVCASCAHPVTEARCSVCREARSSLHGHGHGTVGAAWLALAVVLLLTLAAAAYAHLGA